MLRNSSTKKLALGYALTRPYLNYPERQGGVMQWDGSNWVRKPFRVAGKYPKLTCLGHNINWTTGVLRSHALRGVGDSGYAHSIDTTNAIDVIMRPSLGSPWYPDPLLNLNTWEQEDHNLPEGYTRYSINQARWGGFIAVCCVQHPTTLSYDSYFYHAPSITGPWTLKASHSGMWFYVPISIPLTTYGHRRFVVADSGSVYMVDIDTGVVQHVGNVPYFGGGLYDDWCAVRGIGIELGSPSTTQTWRYSLNDTPVRTLVNGMPNSLSLNSSRMFINKNFEDTGQAVVCFNTNGFPWVSLDGANWQESVLNSSNSIVLSFSGELWAVRWYDDVIHAYNIDENNLLNPVTGANAKSFHIQKPIDLVNSTLRSVSSTGSKLLFSLWTNVDGATHNYVVDLAPNSGIYPVHPKGWDGSKWVINK